MLELKHISKSFQGRKVLDDISISLPTVGMIGIQGESGCGKSTLLYIIGMLDHEFEGEVVLNHEVINHREQYIREHISYMMQNKDFISSLTIKENIVLACQVSEISYTPAEFKKIVTQLGIQNLLHQYPAQLSGGQLKRVSIAKALLKKSSLILCDEPTGALHYQQAQDVMKMLKQVSQNSLIIVVSHDPLLLKTYCDHVITLKNGHLNRKIIRGSENREYSCKHHHSSLWIYSLRQFLYQRNKLMFLFLFQWLVILSFFTIVTAMNGVFDAIHESEKASISVAMMSIENKNGTSFSQFISHPLIQTISYQYHLDQFHLSNNNQDIKSDIAFLPSQTSHITLSSGRLPISAHEIVITNELDETLHHPHTIFFTRESLKINMNVVGVAKTSFLSERKIYCFSSFQKELLFLKDSYSLLIEAKENQNKQLYDELSKNYFCYSEVLERVENYQSLLDLAQYIAYIFIAISFFISLLLIAIVESTIYFERKHDTAYLLSLGLSHRKLIFLSLGEAMLIGLCIAIGGCLCSGIFFYYINNVYRLSDQFYFCLKLHKIIFNQWDLFGIILVSYLLMSIFGILHPMRKMIKTDMIEVLREE